MKLNTNHSIERDVPAEVRSDCKRWRRLVSDCMRTDGLVTPSTEEQYRIVHGRILATCRNLAGQESVPAPRRHLALQLDELLRPWSSPQSLKDAPPNIVTDLVRNQTILDEQLRGRSRNAVGAPLGKLLFTACLAAIGGIAIFLFLQWTSNNPSAPLFRSFQGLLANIAAYLGQTTFTEQFAVALFFSWLFGTWLLSRLSSS
jgi:hypothetical protein